MIGKIEILNKVEKINYLTPPSHIVLVSTISKEGIPNVAPFGMFMIASSKPPMVAVGINPKSDTYRNILDTGEFVIGIPKVSVLEKVYKSGEKLPADVDEFDYVGLTKYSSKLVRCFRIVECCVNIECQLNWVHDAGNHTIFCGNVVAADINEDIIGKATNNVELRTSLDCIYHVTGGSFTIGYSEIRDVKNNA